MAHLTLVLRLLDVEAAGFFFVGADLSLQAGAAKRERPVCRFFTAPLTVDLVNGGVRDGTRRNYQALDQCSVGSADQCLDCNMGWVRRMSVVPVERFTLWLEPFLFD